MPSSLTYEFLLDPAETVHAGQYIQRRQRFARLSWAIWPMLAILGILYLSSGVQVEELRLLGVVALVVASGQILGPWIQRRRYRRLYAETPGLRGPQVYRFSSDGVVMGGSATATTLGWDAIIEVDESDDVFLFFFNKKCAYYLPKRVVGGATAESELRELLRMHLGTRAQRLRA
jgi:hypothetical protein